LDLPPVDLTSPDASACSVVTNWSCQDTSDWCFMTCSIYKVDCLHDGCACYVGNTKVGTCGQPPSTAHCDICSGSMKLSCCNLGL
jgi:hypothetical protein